MRSLWDHKCRVLSHSYNGFILLFFFFSKIGLPWGQGLHRLILLKGNASLITLLTFTSIWWLLASRLIFMSSTFYWQDTEQNPLIVIPFGRLYIWRNEFEKRVKEALLWKIINCLMLISCISGIFMPSMTPTSFQILTRKILITIFWRKWK